MSKLREMAAEARRELSFRCAEHGHSQPTYGEIENAILAALRRVAERCVALADRRAHGYLSQMRDGAVRRNACRDVRDDIRNEFELDLAPDSVDGGQVASDCKHERWVNICMKCGQDVRASDAQCGGQEKTDDL